MSASRKAPVAQPSGRRGSRRASVIAGPHFGWGMPMDEPPVEDVVSEDVKEGTSDACEAINDVECLNSVS